MAPRKDKMTKLSKTSVQLSPEILQWLDDNRLGMTQSEAIRVFLERTVYFNSQMVFVEDLAERYKSILAPALEEFRCENFRTVARALPTIVGGYIQESQGSWKDEVGRELDSGALVQELDALRPAERVYLLDCVVAQRGWSNASE